jgi:hypothetical protein
MMKEEARICEDGRKVRDEQTEGSNRGKTEHLLTSRIKENIDYVKLLPSQTQKEL